MDEINRLHAGRKAGYLVHAAIHTTGNNIGDVALTHAIRSAFDHILGAQTWYRHSLWAPIDAEAVQRFNVSASGMIVGGHGLLTPDTMAHMPSGWQWNIDLATLKALEIPLVVFAVGYNRFRNQEDFSERFVSHLNETVRRARFFGLRNTGSIEQVRRYLEPSLHSKVVLQPCPTTVISRHYRAYKPHLREPGAKRLALNLAFDRERLRFGVDSKDSERRIRNIVRVAKHACQQGWEIHLANHAHEDGYAIPHLRNAGVRFRSHWFARSHPDRVIDFYTRMPLTLGMRGHAQMIPFGCGNAILPLVTHDKLVYFLNDVGHLEWGVEVGAPGFVDQVIARIEAFDRDRSTVFAHVEESQDRFWQSTIGNVAAIGRVLREHKTRPLSDVRSDS